ncbi:fluoride efflux transporter CrcB [Labrys neptuniae]
MSPTLANTIMVAIGGAIGSVGRYLIGLWMAPYSQNLPWATILINIAGSFAITFFGALTVANGRAPLPDLWRVFFMVGICGGFTTFSSFSLQTFELLNMNMPIRALINVGVSVVLCVSASALGYYAASAINSGVAQVAQMQEEEDVS